MEMKNEKHIESIMKTSATKCNYSRAQLALFVLLATHSLHAQGLSYRFTGTVEETNPEIPFPSLENIDPRFAAVQAGDLVSGTVRLESLSSPLFKSNDGPAELLIYPMATHDLHLELNNEVLIDDHAAGNDVLIFNDWNVVGETRDESGNLVFSNAGNPLVLPSIFAPLGPFTNVRHDGITMVTTAEEVSIGDGVSLQMHLNLTDSSGTSFELLEGIDEAASPVNQLIDFERFDVAKGFIKIYGGKSTHGHGILFNIDALEVSAPSDGPTIEISRGFHVAWPSDQAGYTLEEATSAEGPWTPSQVEPMIVDGQNIVVIDVRDELKLYRLVKRN